ncbi:DNA-binding NarL/FixJ family response regulator [Catenulispora sp. EB89]|uniref:response regulator n=1 Tax=Catenulispora sp. EB89 TaxID=3156257 RepID=UPI003514E070
MARSKLADDTPGSGKGSSSGDGSPPREAPRPIRLLLVDRDVRVRVALSETITLESDLVIVADAADAAQALTLADSTRPSVALVDLLLPDTASGLRLVRGLTKGSVCAVVAMSERGGLRDAALAAGAFAFVDKSSDIDAILNTVRASVRS